MATGIFFSFNVAEVYLCALRCKPEMVVSFFWYFL